MTNCEEPSLLPIADALARMQYVAQSVAENEYVSLQFALDRILAQPITAGLDVPAHDNSAMDGYALHSDSDVTKPLQLIGTALAGHPFAGNVVAGTCVRIMTGAPLPAGANCVAMQENTHANGEWISITQALHANENVRHRGEDIHAGEQILAQGKRIGPIEIGLLASLGIDRVCVVRRLRVAVLSTGDELTPLGQPLAPGQIYDSNRYGIIAMLQRLGAEIIDIGLVRDNAAEISTAFKNAAAQADAVISSGGVSVGDADFVKDVLSELGDIGFWKVAIKPGKPFAFGALGNSLFFGLPGNPVSAVVTLHQLTLPILRQMAGEVFESDLLLPLTAATQFKKQPGRCDFQRGRLNVDDGHAVVIRNGAQGSGVLTSLSGANCYVVLERERGSVSEGEKVSVLPFDRFLT